MQGTGANPLWGFSPSLDLQDVERAWTDSFHSAPSEPRLNVLCIGSGDGRHLLKTIARSWRHSSTDLHFYIMESQASLLARQLLLLSVLTDDLQDMGLQERSELFLELFGNLMVRQRTAQWIKHQATQLIQVITDEKGPLSKHLDLSLLKFRERDDLEFVFKFWRDDKRLFDASKLCRYDTRENAIDWDYHMNLRELDPSMSIVYKKEFQRWRMHGIAFEIRDASQDFPNRSMATVDILKQDGVGTAKWGYFSDILLGPWMPFGVDTEYKDMLKKANDAHKYASQEVAQVNIQALLHEYYTSTPYPFETTKQLALEPTQTKQPSSWNVHLLPCQSSETFVKKQKKYLDFFSVIFISSNMAHTVAQVAPLMKPGAHLIVESAKHMMELNKDQRSLFQSKVLDMTQSSGLKMKHPTSISEGVDFLVFVK